MEMRGGVLGQDNDACVQLWLDALAARDGTVNAAAVGARAHGKFTGKIIRFAILGRAVDGFALTLDHGQGTASLEMLAVSPQPSVRGRGRALLEDAMLHAGNAGCSRFELLVRAGNSKAMGLYASAGLQQEGPAQPHPLGGPSMLALASSLR